MNPYIVPLACSENHFSDPTGQKLIVDLLMMVSGKCVIRATE